LRGSLKRSGGGPPKDKFGAVVAEAKKAKAKVQVIEKKIEEK